MIADPEILVIGCGPAGSAAAALAADRGYAVLAVDAAVFPRDKTCGDGLTPRAMAQLGKLGVGDAIGDGYRSNGLKLHGFGGHITAAWPESAAFPPIGSAMRRSRLDALLAAGAAARDGVQMACGFKAAEVTVTGGAVSGVTLLPHSPRPETQLPGSPVPGAVVPGPGSPPVTVRPKYVIVADGVRSPVGKKLGRIWHREQVFGTAARAYAATGRAAEPWIHSHLELTDDTGTVHPGYGWIFPLGGEDGHVNIGCGALSTADRPAGVNTTALLRGYAARCSADWRLGELTATTSALLPMGGAVSNVAGDNWMLIGDAAACVNPLNGEGIDYALETAELAVRLLDGQPGAGFTGSWPALLGATYGRAFTLARLLARALTHPRFLPLTGPLAMRGPQAQPVMSTAARLMGNLVDEADRDIVSRVWRAAGRGAVALTGGRQLWDTT
nr:geranylgeranyl reductase family protein [Corynebacterium mendelii]